MSQRLLRCCARTDRAPARSREAHVSGLRVRVVVAMLKDPAQRTADEALFAALGGLSLDVPTAAQRRAFTPRVARRVAWHLRYGPAHMRGNAAWLLHAHAEKLEDAVARDSLGALHDADVLAALVDAITARALLRTDVAAQADAPQLPQARG